jgi:hypothetical protein
MKNSLLMPVKILSSFILWLLLFSAAAAAWQWLTAFNPAVEAPSYLDLITASVRNCLIPAFIMAVFTSFILSVSSPGIKFLSFLLVFMTIAALIFLLMYADKKLPAAAEEPPAAYPFISGSIHETGKAQIYAEISEGKLVNVLIKNNGQEAGPLSYYSAAFYGNRQLKTAGGKETININPGNPYFDPLFQIPASLKYVFRFFKSINNSFLNLYSEPFPVFAAAALALAFFLASSRSLLKATSWPVLNIILCTAVVLSFSALFSITETDIFTALIQTLPFKAAPAFYRSALLLLFSFIFLLSGMSKKKKGDET